VNVGLVVAFGIGFSGTVVMMRRVVGVVPEGIVDWALGMADRVLARSGETVLADAPKL